VAPGSKRRHVSLPLDQADDVPLALGMTDRPELPRAV
jgi:hypothetical protein